MRGQINNAIHTVSKKRFDFTSTEINCIDRNLAQFSCFVSLWVALLLFLGWLRETTLSYDAAFYTAGATVLVAAGLLSVVKILHRIQHDYMKKAMTNNNGFEEAESAASGESDELFDEKLCVVEKERKFNLIDYTGNAVEGQTFLQKYQDGQMTNSEILLFQVEKANLQKWFDASKETSI